MVLIAGILALVVMLAPVPGLRRSWPSPRAGLRRSYAGFGASSRDSSFASLGPAFSSPIWAVGGGHPGGSGAEASWSSEAPGFNSFGDCAGGGDSGGKGGGGGD